MYPDLAAAGTEVFGISRDDLKSHAKFIGKLEGLPFPLLSDADSGVCNAYGVIKEKNMYGKKVLGIERSTFLIDLSGVVRCVWRKVKIAGHAQAVLTETLKV